MGRGGPATPDTPEVPAATLVRICDPAGRPRGTGFVADDRGTVVTSHEAVDGMVRVVVHAPGDRTCFAEADAITPLPSAALALVRTEGLGVRPLPVTARDRVETGTYVRIAAGGWREARILGAAAQVTYRCRRLEGVLALAIGTDGGDALRCGGESAGGPVLDAGTGAVVAVLGTALRSAHTAAGLAVPLREAAARDPGGPLAELLRRNAATVPGHGKDLNLAGVLQMSGVSTAGRAGPPACPGPPAVPCALFWCAPRQGTRQGVQQGRSGGAQVSGGPDGGFVRGPGGGPGSVGSGCFEGCGGFVRGPGGGPEPVSPARELGCGRPEPVERPRVAREFASFEESGALVLGVTGEPGTGRTTELAALAARRAGGAEPAPTLWLRGADLRAGDGSVADAVARALAHAGRIISASGMSEVTPERVARVAHDSGRPLLIALDGPEEMPTVLAHRLADWTAHSVDWLRRCGVRLVVACRPEYWEHAGPLHPGPVRMLRLAGLTEAEAALARQRYGLTGAPLVAVDARHPLALRLIAEVRAALPGDVPGAPAREDVLGAHLDLMCLRVAVRIAEAAHPPLQGTALRRLAARVAGQVHEAARRCLGPGQGRLDRPSFEELFPRRTGWADAVLSEGLLVPVGNGYRFAHEEQADRLQGAHLDVDAALHSLVHRARRATAAPRTLPVPRHRIGPVVQALLLLDRREGPPELAPRLLSLIDALGELPGTAPADNARWWASHLLRETLLRVPDPRPYLGVLHTLADRITHHSHDAFAPWFWTRLRIDEAARVDLLRRLLPADSPPPPPARAGSRGRRPEDAAGQAGETTGPEDSAPARYLDAVADLLAASPRTVQPLLCQWFTDERPLPAGPGAKLRPTVAGAAQALLYARRAPAVDELCDTLVGTGHPRAEELLAALAEDEPAAVCRAVARWANDERRAEAARYGLVVAPHAIAAADRELLRRAAFVLLGRSADTALHGPALALLASDPATRSRYLGPALARYRAGDRRLPASALAAALRTHPEPVLAAFRARLRSDPGGNAGEALREPGGIAGGVLREPVRGAREALCGDRGGGASEAPRGDLGEVPREALCGDRGGGASEAPREAPGGSAGEARRKPGCSGREALRGDPGGGASEAPREAPGGSAGEARRKPGCSGREAPRGDPGEVLWQASRGDPGDGARDVLRALAEINTPALARRAAALVREYVDLHPAAAAPHAADFVNRRLEHGPAARAVLFPLVTGLLRSSPVEVRRALAPVLAAPGTAASRPLRAELLDVLLGYEQRESRDLAVLDALLRAAALGAADRPEARTRELVHRTGLLLVRTPAGANRFDRRLVELARQVPGFAALVADWLADAPREWALVVGPSTRRTVQALGGGPVPMRTDERGHGSLRPA
ncbi:trypsin-like peptidase domain-containing protein [Streptomyces sp. NPDC000410]|uniref:trypsin-like peptidase domain-containing protein n=1 Tax=Streptomyces sp. NPDC000410 TaxID=3154254 RepID=UPI0033241B90